jgi:hypothetical protein
MKMPRTQARHGDMTGKLKEKLTAEHAVELEERAATMTMATASIAAQKDEVIDLTEEKPAPPAENVGVEGQKYRAPRWVYQHLDEKGVVFH